MEADFRVVRHGPIVHSCVSRRARRLVLLDQPSGKRRSLHAATSSRDPVLLVRFDEHGPAEDQRPAALVVAEQQFLHKHPAFCRCGLPHKPRVLPVRRAGSITSRGCRVALAGGHIDGSARTAPPVPAMRTTTTTARRTRPPLPRGPGSSWTAPGTATTTTTALRPCLPCRTPRLAPT